MIWCSAKKLLFWNSYIIDPGLRGIVSLRLVDKVQQGVEVSSCSTMTLLYGDPFRRLYKKHCANGN